MLGDLHGFIFYLALAHRFVNRGHGFGTKKLKNMGSDLGGAVKGFKDGMKDANGNPTTEEKPVGQVAASATAEKTTIDVEAKTKS